MDPLKRARTVAKAGLTRVLNELQDIAQNPDSTESDIRSAVELLDTRLAAFDEARQGVSNAIQDEAELLADLETQEAYRSTVEAGRRLAVNAMQKKSAPADPSNRNDDADSLSCCSGSGRRVLAKLPKLDLPSFDGTVTEFTSFWEQFEAQVHSNPDIPEVTKFSYLMSVLKGDARSCINGLTLSAANYATAIKLLKDRFGRKQRIIFAHLQALLTLHVTVSPGARAAELWKLMDELQTHVRSLEAMGIDRDHYGVVLTPVVLARLPEDIRMEWARDGDGHEADLEWLLQFLRKEIERRERSQVYAKRLGDAAAAPAVTKKARLPPRATASALHSSAMTTEDRPSASREECQICLKVNHGPARCFKLRGAPVARRRTLIREAGLCFACLDPSHAVAQCHRRCPECSGVHHRLLCERSSDASKSAHVTSPATTAAATRPKETPTAALHEAATAAPSSSAPASGTRHAVLQTAKVKVVASDGRLVDAVALFDSGADRSYMTDALVKKVKPAYAGVSRLNYAPFGARTSSPIDSSLYYIAIHTTDACTRSFMMSFTNVPVICAPLRRVGIPPHVCPSLPTPLADCFYEDRMLDIDLLIGMDQYWSVMTGRSLSLTPDLYAQETRFGWVISGSYLSVETLAMVNTCTSTLMLCISPPSESLVRSMWELEGVGITETSIRSPVDDDILRDFNAKVRYDGERYEVSLPWNGKEQRLASNRSSAEARLASLERKIGRNADLSREYRGIFVKYQSLDIIEAVPPEPSAPPVGPIFYLPHRPVLKASSSTTKVRPVFDASARGPAGLSLNDCLHSGPSLLPAMVDVLLRFRRHAVALTADVKMAFLQIRVCPSDRDAHRFLLSGEDGVCHEMRFQRVPFGNKSSPFLLNATVKHHLAQQPPSTAVSELSENLYVDDWLSGADSIEDATLLFRDAREIMAKAGMELVKWGSNEHSLLHVINSQTGEHLIPSSGALLGVRWYPDSDCFAFDSSMNLHTDVVPTKRIVLSCIARFYDPLGFAAPFVMEAKIIFQNIWRLGLNWDAPLPDDLADQFASWLGGLQALRTWRVPRRLTELHGWSETHALGVELHAFSDASESGYGAVVYLTVSVGGQRTGRIVTSRARVAPLKPVSLPRLELVAALLASRLVIAVRQALHLPIDTPIKCWTDSMVALGWIRGNPARWKTFVANRVSEIQSLLDPVCWRHVPGALNPADLLTRGLSASALILSNIWISGPPFDTLPNELPVDTTAVALSLSELALVSHSAQYSEVIDVSRFSSYSRLSRALAWALRFIANCRSPPRRRLRGELSIEELSASERALRLQSQRAAFPDELDRLSKGVPVSKKSSLFPLAPFVGDDGVLRMRSRLQHSLLSYDAKNPIILPRGHFALLIVRSMHTSLHRAGVSALMAYVRAVYWIVRLRCLVKRVKRGCFQCRRYDERLCSEPTAPLPAARVRPAAPFSVTGVDFAGPLFCSDHPGVKFYILLFTCGVVRAVHIELTASLSLEDFLLAFRRFCARRGVPSIVYSDNARTFKAAARACTSAATHLCSPPSPAPEWRFNVPLAPWWGGFWERLVRSVKSALRKSLGRCCLTRVELETALVSIEGCINSRPLTYSSVDEPDRLITPNHFLLGRMVHEKLSLDDFDDSSQAESLRSSSAARVTALEQFWEIWQGSYLKELPVLVSRFRARGAPPVGSVVLVHDGSLPRAQWPLGVIECCHRGRDGRIRAVDLKTAKGRISRPVQALLDLEVTDSTERPRRQQATRV